MEENSFSKWLRSGKNEDLWWRSSHRNSSIDKNSRICSSISNTCWSRFGIDVEAELDIESYSSLITFTGLDLVEGVLENDCTAWYANSKGLKGIAPSKESSSESEGIIQGSSKEIVLDVIILILAIGGCTLGAGRKKVPSKADSLSKPTLTSL